MQGQTQRSMVLLGPSAGGAGASSNVCKPDGTDGGCSWPAAPETHLHACRWLSVACLLCVQQVVMVAYAE